MKLIGFFRKKVVAALAGAAPETEWKHIANFDESDKKIAYQQAADELGLTIIFGRAGPCAAGRDLAQDLGFRGVYIRAEQHSADAERALTTRMFAIARELGNRP